jgi:hypothetical protein
MASGIYNRFKANILNKVVDMEADVLKLMLLNNSHAFTAAHNEASEITANEITGTGYVVGGTSLEGKAVTQAATTKFDADNTVWPTCNFTAYFGVIYDGSLAGSDLIGCIDFGGAVTPSNGGSLTIQWNAAGVITLA